MSLTLGDGQDLVDRYFRSRSRNDVDGVMALFHEHAEWRPDPFAEPLIGSNAIRATLNRVAVSQTHLEAEAERVWVSGPSVLVSWHGATTDRRTSERTRMRGFLTMEVDDAGLVTRFKEWTLTRMVGIDSTLRAEPDLDVDQAVAAMAEGTRGR